MLILQCAGNGTFNLSLLYPTLWRTSAAIRIPKTMKHQSLCLLAILVSLLTACANQNALNLLVGNDRDDHGCISSAGYTYSYAMHDCVRLWEVGEPYYAGNQQVYLVYSPDSVFAEVFLPKGQSFICKRKRNTDRWEHRKGSEYVERCDGQTCISIGKLMFTPNNE